MSGDASTPVAWREIAQLSRNCVGIQVGEVFVYATESLADRIGTTPERIVGSTPEQLLELAQRSAPDHTGDTAAMPYPSLSRRTIADALETVRTEGFWSGHVRPTTDPGSENTAAKEPDSFPVAVSVTGTGDLIWRSPTAEKPSMEAGEATIPDRGIATDDGAAIPPDHRTIGGGTVPGGYAASAGGPVSLGFETLDALGVATAVLDEDRRVRSWNDRFADATGYVPEALDGLPVEALFTETTPTIPGLLTPIPDGDSDPVVGELLTADGESRRHEFSVAPFGPPTSEGRFRCLLARDLDDSSDHQTDLETVHEITGLLLDTTRELLAAVDRDEIERILCSRLAESDRYRFVWVGQRAADSDRIVVRRGADEERGYLDEVPIASPDSNAGGGVAARALETGDVQVATTAEDPTFEPWRAEVTTRGFESVAAIPLQYREIAFGVLVVYTTRADFSAREQNALAVLGETVGLAIHAERNFELLRTDRVVELEFDVSVVDAVCADVAADLDCNLSLEGYVPSGPRWVLYLSVDGTAPPAAAEGLAGDSRVDRARVVRESDQEGRLEVVVPEAPLLETVVGLGATLKKRVATPSGATLVLEAPKSVDVRAIVEHIQSTYPGSEFIARREDEYGGTVMGCPDGVLDVLTDRQREVLEAAYRAGYYEWPRESTAEEVADSLGIAGSTFHAHLRKAEARVLSGLLDQA